MSNNSLITKIHQGKYDTEDELINLRNNALRLKREKVKGAVNKRLKMIFPRVFQRITGVHNVRNKLRKKTGTTSSERKRYFDNLCRPDREYSNDVYAYGLTVSGGGFGVG